MPLPLLVTTLKLATTTKTPNRIQMPLIFIMMPISMERQYVMNMCDAVLWLEVFGLNLISFQMHVVN